MFSVLHKCWGFLNNVSAIKDIDSKYYSYVFFDSPEFTEEEEKHEFYDDCSSSKQLFNLAALVNMFTNSK